MTIFLWRDEISLGRLGWFGPLPRSILAEVDSPSHLSILWQLFRVGFVGINSANRGDFKTSLNAVPIPYFVVTWESLSSRCEEK